MKRIIAGLITSIVVLGVSISFAYAQDAVDTSDRKQEMLDRIETAKAATEERRNAIDDRTEERRDTLENMTEEERTERRATLENMTEEERALLEEKRTERRAAMDEKRKERIAGFVDRIDTRMRNAIKRLRNIADRIEDRIITLEEKFVDKGLDLSDATNALTEARALIDISETSLNAIAEELESALAADNPKEAFKAVKALFTTAKDDIKAAHRGLKDSVQKIKASVPDRGNAATANTDGEENDEEEANTTEE